MVSMLRATRLSASFEKLCDLRKVILEACGTDDLDDTRRFWAGVPRRCAGHCKACRHMCPALPQRSRHRSAPQFFPQARRRVRPPSYERVAEQAGTERSDFRRLQAVHWSGSPTLELGSQTTEVNGLPFSGADNDKPSLLYRCLRSNHALLLFRVMIFA